MRGDEGLRRGRLGLTAAATAAAAMMVLAGCASAPAGEFREDQYRHRNPAYSFSVPSMWRPASVDEPEAIKYFGFVLKMTYEQAGPREKLKAVWKTIDAVLVSSQGAAIFVFTAPNPDGFRIPREVEISRAEREMIAATMAKEFARAMPDGSSLFRLESTELEQYGQNPALLLHVRSKQELLGKPVRIRTVALTGRRHTVLFAHLGTPEDADAGLDGLAAIARSVRFD
jgi:hypothetical protein